MVKRNLLLLLGLVGTATITFAQEPPQIIWEMEAAATNLTFSADGATMYTGGLVSMPPYSYGNIKRWDVPSRTEVYTLTNDGSEALGWTNALAVTPDGTAFASGHGSTYCPPQGACEEVAIGFHVWNAASGTPQFSLEAGDIDGLVESVAFSRDGEFVAFGMSRSNEEQIRVYNYPEYTLQGTYDGHGGGTYCADFSPTNNLLATGGSDGTVRLWNVATNQLVRTLAHGSYTDGGDPISVAFSPDGSRLAVSGRGYNLKATVWDVSTGALVYSLPADSGAFGTSSATVAFAPNGRYLVAGVMRYISPEWGGVIQIWDLDDGSLVRMYTEATLGVVGSPMFVAVSPVADDWIAYTYDYQVKFAETGLDFGAASSFGVGYCFGDPGSGTPCPCSNDNDGSVLGSGCANGAFASGARLTGSGAASVSADTLILTTTGLEPTNTGLYFQANNAVNGGDGVVFGDGLRCAGGGVIRLQVRTSDSSGSSSTTIAIGAKGGVSAGDTKRYQCWYRDNSGGQPCGVGVYDFNLSNGYELTWLP